MQLNAENPWVTHQLSSVIKEFSYDDNAQSPWKCAFLFSNYSWTLTEEIYLA